MDKKSFAWTQAIVAPFMWGLGFPASKIAAIAFGAHWTVVLRNGIAALFGILFLILFERKSMRSMFHLKAIALGFLPGFYLAFLMLLLTVGIQYTSVANSSFITTLYVIFVPLILMVRYKQKISLLVALLILLSLIGAALLCQVDQLNLNKGDAFTLLGAVASALHIVCVGQLSPRITHSFSFNVIQLGWVFVLLLPFALWLEPLPNLAALSSAAWFNIFYLAIAATLIAFGFQINAQREISSEIVSIIFLLEAPVAAFFGWLILSEAMTPLQMLGAGCILLSSVMIVMMPHRMESKIHT